MPHLLMQLYKLQEHDTAISQLWRDQENPEKETDPWKQVVDHDQCSETIREWH